RCLGKRRCAPRSLFSPSLALAILAGFAQMRHRDDARTFVEREHAHAAAAAPPDADIFDGRTDHRALVGDQHQLILVAHRKDRDRWALIAARFHVFDALTATAGDAIIVRRTALAEAAFGDGEQEFLARGHL